ncbi:MAG: SdrD B-like domain-containing protein [Saprospiraceae bacterium]
MANVGDDQTDSDVVNGIIGSFQVLSGDNNATLDAGLVKTGRIGDFVWHDLNGNGLQDANEPGIAGIQVTLNGTTYLGHPVSKTTFSFTDGQYIFENLLPGTYSVKATLSQGYLFTTSDLGNDQIDADGVNGEVTGILMTSGDNISRIDFGLYKPSEIGNLIWEDTNGNGLNDNGESGLDQINLTLNGQAGDGSIQHQQTTTDATGNYKFSNLKPGHYTIQMTLPNGYTLTQANLGNDDIDSDFDANLQATVSVQSGVSDLNIDGGLIRQASIGDYIWHDQNANGIQDSNEAGMKDVEVSLTGTTNTGQQIALTTFTDMDGKYQFSPLMPGTYEIKIKASNGFVFTLNHAGANDLDSDADQNGVITNIVLVSGQNLNTYDAGLVTHSSIGDFVWEDTNGNGIQDIQEQGIANIEVNLNGTDVFNQQVVKIYCW